MRKLEVAPEEFSAIEDALAIILDQQPFMKTSSIVHEGSSIGIKVGSRNEKELTEKFIESVRLATAALRKQSKIHYRIIYEWYGKSSLVEFDIQDFSLLPKQIELKWLEALKFLYELVYEKVNANTNLIDVEKDKEFDIGDRVVITDGPIQLVGLIVQISAFLPDPQIVCRYFIGDKEVMVIRSADELRSID
jgi:hypothetical protein